MPDLPRTAAGLQLLLLLLLLCGTPPAAAVAVLQVSVAASAAMHSSRIISAGLTACCACGDGCMRGRTLACCGSWCAIARRLWQRRRRFGCHCSCWVTERVPPHSGGGVLAAQRPLVPSRTAPADSSCSTGNTQGWDAGARLRPQNVSALTWLAATTWACVSSRSVSTTAAVAHDGCGRHGHRDGTISPRHVKSA
jgi:hypothetical protein